MSSPAPSTASRDGAPKSKQLEQITFRFCSECSNMLYPKEDEDNHKLQFTCRTCQYTEEATSTCVFRNQLNGDAGETAGVTQDVGSDPTGWALAEDFPTCPVVTCIRCRRSLMKIPESYYMQQETIDETSEESIIKTLMYTGYLLPVEEILAYAQERPRRKSEPKKWLELMS